MHRTTILPLVAAAAVLASGCSDTPRLTSPSGARPSLATEAAGPSHIHQRNVQRNGHTYSVASVDNAQSGRPPATFYVFKDGQIQSVTSVVYKRSDGLWVRSRARTTVFVNGKPAHQATLDANGHRVASAGTSTLHELRDRADAAFVALAGLALPDALVAQSGGGDPILAQENLDSAESQYNSDSYSCSTGNQSACGAVSSDEAAVSVASYNLQASFADYSGDWGSGGDFSDDINAFIAIAGSAFCSDTYCIYLMD